MFDKKTPYQSPSVETIALEPTRMIASSFGDGGGGINFSSENSASFDIDPSDFEFGESDSIVF